MQNALHSLSNSDALQHGHRAERLDGLHLRSAAHEERSDKPRRVDRNALGTSSMQRRVTSRFYGAYWSSSPFASISLRPVASSNER